MGRGTGELPESHRPHSSTEQHPATGNDEKSNQASTCGKGVCSPAYSSPGRRFQGGSTGSNPVGGTSLTAYADLELRSSVVSSALSNRTLHGFEFEERNT